VAYLVDREGRTLGTVDSMDGGYVVSSATGYVSVAPGARGVLARRADEMLIACDAEAHVPALLERLVAGR